MSVEVIDDWATQLIGEVDSPSFELCDLATARYTEREIVLHALHDFPRMADDLDSAWAMFCEFLHDDLKFERRTLKDTVYALYGLKRLHEVPEHLEMSIIILEDEYTLVRDGVWGSLEEVQKRTLDLLRTCFDDETPKLPKG